MNHGIVGGSGIHCKHTCNEVASLIKTNHNNIYAL